MEIAAGSHGDHGATAGHNGCRFERRNETAKGHLACEMRCTVREQVAAHGGTGAIRADQQVGSSGSPIREAPGGGGVGLVQRGEAAAVAYTFGVARPDGAQGDVMQVGAMDVSAGGKAAIWGMAVIESACNRRARAVVN